ncbi:gag-pol polyprotein [Cucumis melo var. makuwa]|uniref:Gag-pol polyprotein n=1 Tax=Cucumis melo var. makuwa TaxID=1194695 RepID=A0A5A7U210_CUCMM|nr:gag-pol polyprotein [Cucumis melo var. makuwa]TYK07990.1 gag-pol polyprotein [Cucumis melo var. makuwa]
MARVMIHVKGLPLNFWTEAVNTACHIHNRVTSRSGTTVTLYELWKGRKPNVKYFHVFGSICNILANKEYHRKWDVKSEQGIFIGYSQNSRAYRVFNNRSKTVMEIINVVVNDLEPTAKRTIDEDHEAPNVPVVSSTIPTKAPKVDIQADSADRNSKSSSKDVTANDTELIPSIYVRKNHPSSSIIGNPSAGITTRKKEKVDY